MIDLIKLNIESIFFPKKTLLERFNKKHQFIDSFLLCWILFIVSASYEICILKISYESSSLLFFSFNLILFKLIIFPISLFFDLFIDFLILKMILPKNYSDRWIDTILGSSLSSSLFLVIPLLGPIAFYISSKINFLVGVKQQLSWGEAVIVLFFPTLLSIVFIAFFSACGALTLASLGLF